MPARGGTARTHTLPHGYSPAATAMAWLVSC